MTDRDAFVAAIIAEPRDDLRRMAFADWLDEHDGDKRCPNGGPCISGWIMRTDGRMGADQCRVCEGTGSVPNGYSERAEFIRVQVELVALKASGGKWSDTVFNIGDYCECRTCGLRRRERVLWDQHKCGWFGERWAILNLGRPEEDSTDTYPDLSHAFVVRGFVAEVRCPLAVWQEHGPRLVREHPIERAICPDMIGERDYGAGDERPAIYQKAGINAGLWGLMCQGAGSTAGWLEWADWRYIEFPDYEQRDGFLSHHLIAWAKQHEPLPPGQPSRRQS